jgi:hypothetical protein
MLEQFSGVPKGGVWGVQTPPKFLSFDKAEPNFQFSGKYIHNSPRHPESLKKSNRIANWAEPLIRGLYPQIPVLSALCPQLNMLNRPLTKIPGYARHWISSYWHFWWTFWFHLQDYWKSFSYTLLQLAAKQTWTFESFIANPKSHQSPTAHSAVLILNETTYSSEMCQLTPHSVKI